MNKNGRARGGRDEGKGRNRRKKFSRIFISK